jgi:DNA-binding CsgD family transcriptional regulator
MDRNRVNIAVIEYSDVVFEGLATLLLRSGKNYNIMRFSDFGELVPLIGFKSIHLIIVNPTVIQNRAKELHTVKVDNPEIFLVGLLYSFFDGNLLKVFDATFSILDPIESIIKKLNHSPEGNTSQKQQEILTERETDVLIQLVKGLSNKEIAEELNISIHTVISHRKNIVEKTGIKSLSGLTIYAIAKQIVPLDLDLI